MKHNIVLIITIISISLLSGCKTAGEHREAVRDDSADRVTVGKVQREIAVGMSSAEVAEVLGSPNIVSTDQERREVWIYDKVSTETVHSTSKGGVSALILGYGGSSAGLGGGNYGESSGATSTSQRTLTIIIKFDKNNKVRDFSYRTSRF